MDAGEDWTDVVVASHRGIRAFNEHIRPILEGAGFSHLGMGNILFLLTVGEDGTRVTDMVKVHGFIGSNVSYGLSALTDAGLVRKDEDSEDRRIRSVALTPRGIALVRALKEASRGPSDSVRAAMGAASSMRDRFEPGVGRHVPAA